MAPVIETLKAALGPHWARIALLIAGSSYAVVSLLISAINGFSETHGFGFLIPSVSKVAYTFVALSIILVFWFGKFAHQLRLASIPALEIDNIINEQFHPDHGVTNVKVSIQVRNTGQTALTNCLVKVVDLSGDASRYGHFTSRAVKTRSQGEQGRHGAFNLRGGEHKDVPLLQYQVTAGDTFARLHVYFEDETQCSFDPEERNIITVGLYSESPAKIYKLRLNRLSDGFVSVARDDS